MQKHYPHSILSHTNSSSLFCPLSPSNSTLNNNTNTIGRRRTISSSLINGLFFEFKIFKATRRRNRIRATEGEPEFEIDPDKAREALRKLDQQLQSLSTKQINPPKIRASEVNLERDLRMREEEPEFGGTFLPYTALILVIFTIFYNVIFLKVIVPSIDGPVQELSPPSVPMVLREDASQPQKSPPLLE